jgi:hypothetical protein
MLVNKLIYDSAKIIYDFVNTKYISKIYNKEKTFIKKEKNYGQNLYT